MSTTNVFVTFSIVAGLYVSTNAAIAQDYPTRPVRIVAGLPGGGGDFEARLIAQIISSRIGQQIIVDNRASQLLGEIVAKSPPDGYTLLIAGSTMAFAPLMGKTNYDPLRDFSYISTLARAPNVLVTHPSLPAKTVKELVALAKARPGELNYSTGPSGGTPHLAGELFKIMAGVNILRVPYKGGQPAIIGVMSGQEQLSFNTVVSVAPHVKSGRLRALAVTSATPSALAPELPTIAGAGLPGYEIIAVDFMLAPAKTPAAVVSRVNQEIVRFLNQADVKERFLATGVEAMPSTPDELAASMKSEIAKAAKLIKDAGITAD